MTAIRLDSPAACQEELQRCSNNLATLTQEATANREALGHFEEQLEIVESIVAAAVREGEDKITATEVKGRITAAISEDEHFGPIREAVHELRTEATTLDRRLRTLEKRSMNAQSALKAHDSEARNASYGGSQ